ncbi:Glucan endo-1,3-beta-glucosidase-like protein [Hapsidospora chrysogenum ATCC 11550]|uniref:Glucan endo-1,3-beta-glucosidase-like protein n=1 Tax=Hapsidospora chrysogenum (strain ATCC 11550 / CBS 779.69 / DSM 880 / IAM 14645 / JCM 23072 / IMI 49137) TaxID=857340 RepID=A0A086T664_HAPC1|nr:Glucan endo-1,3-beta-glucosidase-like protein [Hapsidospora chrysogenum ATCC 11550]
MRILSLFAAALLGSAASVSGLTIRSETDTTPDGFTKIRPGGIKDLIVSEETTLNGTHKGDPVIVDPSSQMRTSDLKVAATLPMHFVNNLGTEITAYLTGKDESGRVAFIRRDGSMLYPSSGGSAVPVPISQDVKIMISPGGVLDMTLPVAIESGRIYFSVGELQFGVVATPDGEGIVQPAPNNPADPSSGVNWGFVEFTLLPDGALWANISFVDFVGLPLGMELTVHGGGDTQSAYGVYRDAVAVICDALRRQEAADGRPWSALCMAGADGKPVRALSPTGYSDINPDGFRTYWDDYANRVWAKYANEPLVINTQSGAGHVDCRVSGNMLSCEGDNRPYPKPTAIDIWGCNSGPFGKIGQENAVHLAVIPRLCAAFVRSTLLVNGGNVQPALGQAHYYKVDPTNHYSRLVHENEVDGKGYAFAYDDVNPDGLENASGTVSSGSPKTLSVFIGSPP